MATRQMALTPSLVAQVHRVVQASGPDPTIVYHTEEDYDAVVRSLLTAHPLQQETWFFAYGSLIWKPEIDQVQERSGPMASEICDLCRVNAVVIQEVVEADADFPDVADRIGCCTKADDWIHLAHDTLIAAGWSEPDLALTDLPFKQIKKQQSFMIHIDIDATVAVIVAARRNLRALHQVMQLLRPINNKALGKRQVRPLTLGHFQETERLDRLIPDP